MQRIQKLKTRSNQLVIKLNEINPSDHISLDTVTNSGLTFSDITEKITHMSECATLVQLGIENVAIDGVLEQRLHVDAANYCKQPTICPTCSDRVQARRQAKLSGKINEIAVMVEAGSVYPYMVTGTITDCALLFDAICRLQSSIRNFRRMGQKRKGEKSSGGEASKIVGGFVAVEMKRGKNSELWHAHFHGFFITNEQFDYLVYDPVKKRELKKQYGRSIPKEKLDKIALHKDNFNGNTVALSKISKEWLAATDGTSTSISVDPVQHVPRSAKGKKILRYLNMTFAESVSYQIKEILKYAYKPSIERPQDVYEVISATHNRRLFSTYGVFRGIPTEEYDSDESPDRETFLMSWNDTYEQYGNPVPGKIRDLSESAELLHNAHVQSGKETGVYRRSRRFLISLREKYGADLYNKLDSLKSIYRKRISGIWSQYNHALRMLASTKSDGKYSPIAALGGAFVPGSDHKLLYASVFG